MFKQGYDSIFSPPDAVYAASGGKDNVRARQNNERRRALEARGWRPLSKIAEMFWGLFQKLNLGQVYKAFKKVFDEGKYRGEKIGNQIYVDEDTAKKVTEAAKKILLSKKK